MEPRVIVLDATAAHILNAQTLTTWLAHYVKALAPSKYPAVLLLSRATTMTNTETEDAGQRAGRVLVDNCRGEVSDAGMVCKVETKPLQLEVSVTVVPVCR